MIGGRHQLCHDHAQERVASLAPERLLERERGVEHQQGVAAGHLPQLALRVVEMRGEPPVAAQAIAGGEHLLQR